MVKRKESERSQYPDSTAQAPGGSGVNPFRGEPTGGTGKVNPSGPSTGTEGWGIGPGEANTTGVSQGSLGKERGTRTFRCADIGNVDCPWEVTGHTEDELLPQIKSHAREQHRVQEFDESTQRKIHELPKTRAA